MPIKDRTGMIYGCYTVLRQSPERSLGGTVRWVCRCNVCNAEHVLSVAYFKADKLSINCSSCSWKRNFKGYEEIPLTYWSRVEAQARQRGLSVGISIEDAWNIFLIQRRKCYYTGEDLKFGKRKEEQTASLDRVDSKKGYELGNIVWCHKDVNRMKSNLTESRFRELCNKIVNLPKVPEFKE